ncbi:MAG TPA: hypothetical protein ENN46_04515 [Candidatus Woesearchaeota archaeon]|nr:hypothetical protein [Candidatus Woesearchaeota archaeon]
MERTLKIILIILGIILIPAIVLFLVFGLTFTGVINPMNIVPEKCNAPSGFICNSARIDEGILTLVLTPQVYGSNLTVTRLEVITPSAAAAPGLDALRYTPSNQLAGMPITITAPLANLPRSGRQVHLVFDLEYVDDFSINKKAEGGEIVVEVS